MGITGARPPYEQCRTVLRDRQPPTPRDAEAPESMETSPDWIREHTCPTFGQPLIVTAYLPSSLTGKIIPRVPLGHAPARPLLGL